MSQFQTKLYQSVQLRQEMRINPRLYQAMELLAMPALELEEYLEQELTENPFLERTEAEESREVDVEAGGTTGDDDPHIEHDEYEGLETSEDPPGDNEPDTGDPLQDYDFDDGVFVPPGSGREGESGMITAKEVDQFELIAVEAQSLLDHLYEQLRFLSLSERELRLGEEIIGDIDDSGILACDLEEALNGANDWLNEVRPIALQKGGEVTNEEERVHELEEIDQLYRPYQLAEAERMLSIIQSLEPPGIGARDVRESLLIQLTQLNEDQGFAYNIIEGHFESFIRHRWNDIARALGISPKEVQDVADKISHLDPKPGLRYSTRPQEYVIPDLIVRKIDGDYMVFPNDTIMPRLRIAQSTLEAIKSPRKLDKEEETELRDFASKKHNGAKWMVQAIEQRRQTMLKVMNFIVDRQYEYFERGVQYLKPLTLREVADHIGMHESTVSRVTNKKFVQTPRGVYSLKYFFSSGLSTATGEDLSARAVKDRIKGLVSDEDPAKPFTDERIVKALRAEGIKIARRTVAKYRDQLGILPARIRKRV